MGKDTYNSVIHFRCHAAEKEALSEVAERNGMTLGELMRKGMKTIKVIFGTDISVGDLIIRSDVLLEDGKSKG